MRASFQPKKMIALPSETFDIYQGKGVEKINVRISYFPWEASKKKLQLHLEGLFLLMVAVNLRGV